MSLDLMSLQPLGQEKALLANPHFDEHRADISPDGHWLAYVSDETGRSEVYIRPFPNVNGGRWQISTGGGDLPAWSRNGRTLYYLSPPPQRQMMAVAVQLQPAFAAGEPRPLFPFSYDAVGHHRSFDVAPDGRFLVVKSAAPALAQSKSLTIVTNWVSEVAARVH